VVSQRAEEASPKYYASKLGQPGVEELSSSVLLYLVNGKERIIASLVDLPENTLREPHTAKILD
jgi:hypothetical protein